MNSSFILFFPFAFLTTTFLPQDALTGWLATVADYNPVTYLLAGLRALISDGWVLADLLAAVGAVAGVGVVSFGPRLLGPARPRPPRLRRLTSATTEERMGAWSYGRQLLGRHRATDPDGALRGIVGVYSSHPCAPLSLHARCAALDAADFRRLDARALRLPAMRGSILLLPRETAHLAFRAVPESPSGRDSGCRYFGLSEERYAELREAVLAAATEPTSQGTRPRAARERPATTKPDARPWPAWPAKECSLASVPRACGPTPCATSPRDLLGGTCPSRR